MKIFNNKAVFEIKVDSDFWKEGCDYNLLDNLGFELKESLGYWKLAESYLFEDFPLGKRRIWCIHKSYFKRVKLQKTINKKIKEFKKTMEKAFINWYYIKLSPDDIKACHKINIDLRKLKGSSKI